jgi:hypothetical protein
MSYESASALTMGQAMHAAGWLDGGGKTASDARAEAAPNRDRILEDICTELRITPPQLHDLKPGRLEAEVRERLPERARQQAIDVGTRVINEFVERQRQKK